MKRNVLLFALTKNTIASLLLYLVLCICAGTFYYLEALVVAFLYLFLGHINFIALSIYNKSLLEKRVNLAEKNFTQKKVVAASCFFVWGLIVIAGISYRYDFLMLGWYKYLIAAPLIILGGILYFNVVKVNNNLSSTINNAAFHDIISTGPYGIIRHPMYISTILFVLGFCLCIGSLISLIMCIILIPLLVLRIISEEKVLLSTNEQYREYVNKVKYRLIPFVW